MNLSYTLLWQQRKFNMVNYFAKAKSRFQWNVSWSAVQAEGVNVMVNSIHPGCIDTNFGKGEIPFLANKVVRGESYNYCSFVPNADVLFHYSILLLYIWVLTSSLILLVQKFASSVENSVNFLLRPLVTAYLHMKDNDEEPT